MNFNLFYVEIVFMFFVFTVSSCILFYSFVFEWSSLTCSPLRIYIFILLFIVNILHNFILIHFSLNN